MLNHVKPILAAEISPQTAYIGISDPHQLPPFEKPPFSVFFQVKVVPQFSMAELKGSEGGGWVEGGWIDIPHEKHIFKGFETIR